MKTSYNHLLPLPYGITGFYTVSKDKSLEVIADKVIMKSLFHILKSLGFNIIDSANNNREGQSYYRINAKNKLNSINILINMYYPIISFVDQDGFEFNNFKFINNQEVGNDIQNNSDLFYLDIDFLNILPDKYNLSLLDKSELRQIKSWKPNTIGNIIFNQWD